MSMIYVCYIDDNINDGVRYLINSNKGQLSVISRDSK